MYWIWAQTASEVHLLSGSLNTDEKREFIYEEHTFQWNFAQLQDVQLPPQSNFETLSSPLRDSVPIHTPLLQSSAAAFSISVCALDFHTNGIPHGVPSCIWLALSIRLHPNYDTHQTMFLLHQLVAIYVDPYFSRASSASTIVFCLLSTAVLMGVMSLIVFELHFS